MLAGSNHTGEGDLVHDFVHQNGFFGDGGGYSHSVDLLDAALANFTAGEIGHFHLASDDEEFAAFEIGARNGGDDVGETGARGDEGKSFGPELKFIAILRGNSCGNLMSDGDALDAAAATLKQMHDVATCDKEAVGVAKVGEPICEDVAILRH